MALLLARLHSPVGSGEAALPECPPACSDEAALPDRIGHRRLAVVLDCWPWLDAAVRRRPGAAECS
ncbi:MAG: hypothetical protein M0Z82_07815 [Actinomycetota bacterium]|nr:hypothetical protein [Actinomycetota bacterium]